MRHLEAVRREGGWKSGEVLIENLTDDLGVLSVAGPLSPCVMDQALQRTSTPESAEAITDSWKFLEARRVEIGGVPNCLAVRISYTGEHGWEIYMPRYIVPEKHEKQHSF